MTITPFIIAAIIGFLLWKQQDELIGGMDHHDMGAGGGFALLFVVVMWMVVVGLIIAGLAGYKMF